MRRSPLEEGQRWLAQAEEDLKWVKDLADRGGYYLACFLAQQTGEKAMKAFLYAQGEEVVLGHSVERLCTMASQWKPDLKESLKRWAVLDTYYIPTRYPNGLPDSIPAKVYTEEIAKGAAALAEEIVLSIRSELDRLSGEIR
jgi:HEPN domain-containing protein